MQNELSLVNCDTNFFCCLCIVFIASSKAYFKAPTVLDLNKV